jgi:hypothetical protein
MGNSVSKTGLFSIESSSKKIQRLLTIVYNAQNCSVPGLCSSSGILFFPVLRVWTMDKVQKHCNSEFNVSLYKCATPVFMSLRLKTAHHNCSCENSEAPPNKNLSVILTPCHAHQLYYYPAISLQKRIRKFNMKKNAVCQYRIIK